MDRNELAASIVRLRARKEQLLREIDELDTEIKTQNAKYTRIVNDDAPVYRLPNELLTDILLACQRAVVYPRKGFVAPFQVMMSHVSHRWRTIVLATPLLWNRVFLHVNPTSSNRVLAQLDAHLIRSEGCFLDITLDFMSIADLTPYLSRLAHHASRWRRFSIASNLKQEEDFKTFLCKIEAPMLEHLSLTLGNLRDEEESGSPRKPYPSMECTALVPGLTPPLTFLRLAGHALGQLHPPMSSLTTLHLDGWTRHYTTADQLTRLLEAAPRLVNLSLNQLFMHHLRDPLVIPQAVVLPRLRQLRLRGPCSHAARFLTLIAAPGLEALALQHIDGFDAISLPSVRRITIEGCAFDDAQLAGLMRSSPGVVELGIDESVPDVFTLLLPTTLPRLWPGLRTLAVRELQTADVAHLCALIFSLQEATAGEDEAGESLSAMYLDRRSRTVLRGKHRLDWVQERLRVHHRDEPEPWPLGLGYEDAHDLLE